MSATTLSTILSFHALDRVQINDRATRREIADFSRLNSGRMVPPPFWFFQKLLDDGRMLVRSPGGTTAHVAPEDICDVRPRADGPIIVQAMPVHVWLRRARERAGAPSDADYAPARLLWVRKDRWGRSEALVDFLDQQLNAPNEGTHRIAPIAVADQARLQQLATRRNMPVAGRDSASSSADAGEKQGETRARAMVSQLIAAATAGDAKRASAIAMGGR